MTTPNTIRIKRSATTTAPATLQNAELAYSEASDILYYGKGSGGSGGSATQVVAIGGTGAFLTLTNASSTYQTISGMASYATQSYVTSQGYITNTALAPYLTSATAASTYQTLAGMSVYAPLDSASLTGTPTAPTASTSDSSTLLATTAFVKNQGYLTTSLASSTYLTQANASSTYLTLSSAASTYAPLNSPALTGTPTAPTPTIGDNSTAIATTAFVKGSINPTTNFYTQGKNNTGATIPAGAVVYINGSSGGFPSFALAQANSSATSDITFGVAMNAIANGSNGTVITAGILSNVNTSAWSVGTLLWLSPTTAGGLTSTIPSAPNHSVFIGFVTTQSSGSGQISVNIQNGYQLEELHNVAISSVANQDLLSYNSSTSVWNNTSISSLGLATQSYVSSYVSGLGYLTTTLAASTYQTLSGMSSYLTISSASSTYLSQSSAASTYAPLASPALTGVPTAPTATAGTSTTQIASTAFVSTAISNLVASAPSTLNTLNELATALGDDPNFATTVTNSIAGKLSIANNLSDLNSISTARTNLGLGDMATQSSSSVSITGGSINGITIDGGTF